MENLSKKIPCRIRQSNLLLSLFGEPAQYTLPSFFIYGHTGTGKSLVIKTIMNTLQLPHVVVNSIECFNQRIMYELILNKLMDKTYSATQETEFCRCDNMNDFVGQLKKVCHEKQLDQQTVYVILDKAEYLREKEINILPAFLRLQELSQLNVCVILLTEIVWEKFRTGTGYCEPYIVHFPDYSKEEIVEILLIDYDDEFGEEFHRIYLNLMLSVFYVVCRDVRELKHLALLNYSAYVHPIKSGDATTDDTRKLWKNIEPHLKKTLQTVYLREISSAQYEKYQQDLEEGKEMTKTGITARNNVELPYYSKFLLIAAYLASYNPAKSDKRFFAKNAGKISKKSKLQKKHERTSNHMLGPKPFPLDRLMAIFYSIVEGKVTPTANIFMQVSSLVSLNLLGHVVGADQIDLPKYKCLVSLDFIKSVSRTVGFDVIHYLYDFI